VSNPTLEVGSLTRQLANGNTEELKFAPGVNLLVGKPNTGKTKWLQTLDYLLGEDGDNPYDSSEEEELVAKYDAAAVELFVGGERYWVERRWRERGAKGKLFVNGEPNGARDFQLFLLEKLEVPELSFPKGNPMSGQTWPLLSFRMLLRHMFRRQLFWGDIADKQPEGEQHACIMQFLGLAENLYTDDYGRLVALKLKSERLKARREQYGRTLDDLARDIVSDPDFTVGVNSTTIQNVQKKIQNEMDELRVKREALISGAANDGLSEDVQSVVSKLAETRATIIVKLEEHKIRAKASAERIEDLSSYHSNLANEMMRLDRAEDAGRLLSDLKVTHCPACDQEVTNISPDPDQCFLCHQKLPEEPLVEGLGAVRLQFEKDRLKGEEQEAKELLLAVKADAKKINEHISEGEEILQKVENELKPARQIVAGLIQDEISAIDMDLGELNERQRQIDRVNVALRLGQGLTDEISELEREISPLREAVDEAARATDFAIATAQIEEGMNAYLQAINKYRAGSWRHSPVSFDVYRNSFTIRVGAKKWQAALGGTDTLYFLMAYHYGLMTLSCKEGFHYPGLTIIDVPGEFSGEAVEDKENFIVQPFIELLNTDEYQGVQFIITGAAFTGLDEVNRIHLTHVHTA